MDGVLWRGGTPLPGLSRLFETLRVSNVPFVLATNSAARTPADCCAKLAGFGVAVAEDRVVTSAICAALDLRARRAPPAVYVVGEQALAEAIEREGFTVTAAAGADVGTVIVGFDRDFTYAKLRDASALVRRGADFVATNLDHVFPVEGDLMPGAGAIAAAIVAASERQPRVVGKPALPMFEWAVARLGAVPDEILVVGDRLDTDIAGAAAAGMQSALVLTGVDGAATETGPQPDLVLSGLDELSDWLSVKH